MPRGPRRTSGTSASERAEPYRYPKKSPKDKSDEDKENINPTKKSSKAPKSTPHFDGDWRDIVLEEKKGEVPCYDKASVVRTKLNKLIQEKKNIPGSQKKWSQASMVEVLQDLEDRSHPVADETHHNATLNTRQMAKFLKQSGGMGGGDSPVYYWGNVLLEKLRIANGEKKTKGRKEAEEK